MPDASVISRMNGKPRELTQGGSSTSEIVFSTDGTTPVVLPLPSAGQLAGGSGTSGYCSRFQIRAWGRVTGGTTTNYTPQLQYGTSITSTSNTDIESGAAVAVNSVSGTWQIIAEVIWDATSDILDGFATHMVSGSTRTLTAWAAFDNAITSANPEGDGTLGFVVTGTFSSGAATNAAYLDGFEIIK